VTSTRDDEDPDWWGYHADEPPLTSSEDVEQTFANWLDNKSRAVTYVLAGLTFAAMCCLCGMIGWVV
jgi:hypothetical protein